VRFLKEGEGENIPESVAERILSVVPSLWWNVTKKRFLKEDERENILKSAVDEDCRRNEGGGDILKSAVDEDCRRNEGEEIILKSLVVGLLLHSLKSA
jgi:hypothetical protein